MKRLFLSLVICFVAIAAFAQKASMRGNVYDKATAEPLPFVSVQLEGTGFGANTDVNGFFTISSVPPGSYNLVVTSLGFQKFTTAVVLKGSQIEFQNIYLEDDANELTEVVISGKKEKAQNTIQISTVSVSKAEIRALPAAGGEPDIAQYLTVLPGVVFTGDQGGQLYIRGGSPIQNKIMLDGMTIYNPFHSIGFFSVFETELIRNVDVLTGGFGAEHGNRISAIVDVKTREGNRKKFGGLVSASPFQVKGVFEGPIVKLKSDDGSSISLIVAGKKGLISNTSKALYGYVNDSVGIPFDYQDLYGKLSLMSGNGSKFNLFGFNYDDGVKYPATSFGWTSSGAGADFTLIPANSNTIISGVFTYSGYNSKIDESDRRPRTSSVGGLFGNINFTSFGRNSEIKYGMEINGFTTDFKFVNFKGLEIQQRDNTTETAAFIKYRQKIGNLVIEPSFRLQYYNTLAETSPEPRIGMKYNLNDKTRLKAAGGLYSQNLLTTVNDRDIVNLFVGFLSGTDASVADFDGNPNTFTKSRLQKAWHAVGGIERDITDNIEINVEGYFKDFTQLIALNRNKTRNDEPDFKKETGEAYGLDFLLKYNARAWYFWGAYSYALVNRFDGQQTYPPVFDRRHNMNLLATYQAGKKKRWELGARLNFGTGFPFTLTQGFNNQITFDDGINTDIYGGNTDDAGDIGIIYASERNSGRLPTLHRLDISAKRSFSFGKYTKLELNASCTNVYNRENIFYFDRVKYERVNQLPILPSMSATLEF
jgi:CarboxypepD_reg-like domain/TonB-dependent Receptor Plug Domain